MAIRKTYPLTAAVLSLLAMVATGCSGGEGEDDRPRVPDIAKKFCDSSLTPPATRAFEKLLAGKNVKEPTSSGKLTKAAHDVKQVPRDDLTACEVMGYDSVRDGVDIRFGWSYGLVTPSRKYRDASFSVADQAFSNGRLTYILLKCSASVPKLDPDEKHYLVASLNGPDSDLPVAERRKLHISILYPVLRKMAGIIGCKEAAALPATPSIKKTTAPK
ncbi:hypothetical protein [Streptomyces sp. NBC_00356]|uniref:hypothetical protein n=1 Tax=Streptomyces sp. NBC_00356 TaxID=2975724 RepID=UPI002E262BD9